MFEHLREQNISYISHYLRSFKFAMWCARMYFVCLVHAVLPFMFSDTFSKNVLKLAEELERENAEH